ncbi:hypothetical protein [Streptococcus moroccensis]|uniref:Uncharacterized protein n=1 Tax=Streptococcus moroccensis TaxID=1451356 RepID=A0ABT9YNT1_9STRE|nr:hypothetical protein [Streptococcus moroccensis]MDQ0221637.1 hypothetical protein [Streptococcus moroccensis]
MKQIENYQAEKYQTSHYQEVEAGIYQTSDQDGDQIYVTSLSFVQEPELGEGSGELISQYPLEDLLDEFYCHINDFYEEENKSDPEKNVLEFASPDLEDVQKLRSIIGKHVYNVEEDDMVRLVIE